MKMKELDSKEIEYYSRQLILPNWNLEIQTRLKNAKVIVVGAGALGCAVLQSLSRSGVGVIGIADEDIVSQSNLQRQILFDSNDIGKPKAHVAAQKISQINPNIQTKIYNYHVNSENVQSLIKEFDIVVDGSDNFETKYLLNDECAEQKKPLVYAAIEKYEGQVSVFNVFEDCPTYRCIFPEPPSQNLRTDCESIGVSPFLPQIIGGIQAAETIKLITGIGEPLCGKLLLYDSLKTKFSIFSFNLNPKNKSTLNSTIKKPASNKSQADRLSLDSFESERNNFFIIDVRDEEDHKEFNIGGINIPLYELENRLDMLEKQSVIVAYCDSGLKAKQAAIIISHALETKVYYLDASLKAFKNSEK